ALNIVVPEIVGCVCLAAKGYRARQAVVSVTSILLIASSILMVLIGRFSYSPSPSLNLVVAVLDLAIIAYFLTVGLRKRHPLVIGLSMLQLLPLTYLELTSHIPVSAPVFIVDSLAIVISAIVNVVGSFVCIYALGYMQERYGEGGTARAQRFFFFMLLFLGAMNGLVYSNSILWLCLFWEATTLCCYELIRHDRTLEAERNAEVALWMGLVGGASLVGALLLGHYGFGTDLLTELVAKSRSPLLMLGFALMALAGFTKSAQLPFHSWLLGAMVAPTPVSALLHSSTMVNAGAYLILRLAPAMEGTSLAWIIGLVGGCTFTITAYMAVKQNDSKRILAYSTSGNLGLIIMCAGASTAPAYSGAILLLLFHSVSKGLLFMGAGAVENRVETRDIGRWEGLIGRLPLTATIMIVAMASMFLPPFGMLLGKWAALEAVASAPLPVTLSMAFLLVMGSAMTALFWARWIAHLTVLPVQDSRLRLEALPFSYRISMGGLLAMVLGLGVTGPLIMDELEIPFWGEGEIRFVAPFLGLETGVGSFPVLILWIASSAILACGYALYKLKGGKIEPPYMGGENVKGNPTRFRTTADEEAELSVGLVRPGIVSDGLGMFATVIGIAFIGAMFLVVFL
ncbi:MAG: proton-conducting transporter membrane subunit, partial [Candidatus Verstraetearchaeota archaeon]|nr:proton-conducting transporter membrane subunit [Candidatus Verstraetearchaeota archaeon]